MSKGKHRRTKLRGQYRALLEHQAKIEAELVQAVPNLVRIEGWRETIRNIEQVIARLERRRSR